jgi:hypothetical protein
MLVQQGTPELLFLDAETGKPLKAPERTGVLSFVATGKSERTMIGYAPSGLLSYWDLESGKEIRRFIVPDRIGSPVLFGNNRFLVGIDPRGLVVLDAVSGNIIARDRRISQGKVLNLPGEAPELLCITPDADASRVYHVAISVQGKLELKTQWPVPLPWQDLMSATLTSDAVILGTLDGSVWIGKKDEKGGFMQERRQEPVIDIAATASFLAFLTKEETLGFIPLDYTQLLDKMVIPLSAAPYTRLASDPDAGETDTEGLLLWHEETAASLPRFMTLGEASSGESLVLDQLSRRFPLRSVALRGEAALFLDASGNITMLSARTGERLFSFASVAALDAALLKDGNILIGQSVIAGNTPFLMVNSRTGETLPLTLSASVGARVYCGASGVPYGVTVDPQEGRLNTTIIQLSLANPSRSSPVAVYPGEDTGFGMAEVQGSLVAALGGETAVRYGSKRKDALERTEGFPLRLIDGGSYCLVLDTEGTIAWYDPASGTLLACFHVYEYEWILEKPGYPLIRGGFKAAPQGEQAES